MANSSSNHLEIWSAGWCGDCQRTKRLLETFQISYENFDVDADEATSKKVEDLNEKIRGTRMGSIPVLHFLDDDSYLIEPTNEELLRKLLRLQMITRAQVEASSYPLPNGV